MPWRRLENPVVADDPMAGEAEPPTEDDPEQEAEDHSHLDYGVGDEKTKLGPLEGDPTLAVSI